MINQKETKQVRMDSWLYILYGCFSLYPTAIFILMNH